MMLIREFISETNKNKMISDLLKYYKVGSVKVKIKSMKNALSSSDKLSKFTRSCISINIVLHH